MPDFDPFADPAEVRRQHAAQRKMERRNKFILGIISLVIVAGIQGYRWHEGTLIRRHNMVLLEKPLVGASTPAGTVSFPMIFPRGTFNLGLAAELPETFDITPFTIQYTCKVIPANLTNTSPPSASGTAPILEWSNTLNVTTTALDKKAREYHAEQVQQRRDEEEVYLIPASMAPRRPWEEHKAVFRFEPPLNFDQGETTCRIELKWQVIGELPRDVNHWFLRLERVI